MTHSKIATCCYCGTRAALVLKGESRHELACATCGAPLHEMKQLHPAKPGKKVHKGMDVPKSKKSSGKHKKNKKKKSLSRRILGEAFDILEDIFD